MGMFDRFYIEDVCPTCGKEVNEIQSKDFDCELIDIHLGDTIPNNCTDLNIINAYVIKETHCCGNEVKLHFKDNVFDSYEFIIKEK